MPHPRPVQWGRIIGITSTMASIAFAIRQKKTLSRFVLRKLSPYIPQLLQLYLSVNRLGGKPLRKVLSFLLDHRTTGITGVAVIIWVLAKYQLFLWRLVVSSSNVSHECCFWECSVFIFYFFLFYTSHPHLSFSLFLSLSLSFSLPSSHICLVRAATPHSWL